MISCQSCQFFMQQFELDEKKEPKPTKQGICRRYPPMLLNVPNSKSIGEYQSCFPAVKVDMYCGEYDSGTAAPEPRRSAFDAD